MVSFLIIETSGDDSFVALCANTEVLASLTLPFAQHSKFLLPVIQDLFKKTRLTLSDLSFIAIGKGPGSFTGTRIGVMTAKTLSFAQAIPLVPFCSLHRFTPSSNGSFITLLDGKSNGVYGVEGEKSDDGVCFIGTKTLFTDAELPSLLEGKTFILSPHISQIQKRLPSLSSSLSPHLSPHLKWMAPSPNLTFIAQMVYDNFFLEATLLHSELEVAYPHLPK